MDVVSEEMEHRFEIAHPVLPLIKRISTPPPPPSVSSHSVASFGGSGLSIRTAKEQKPWKAPGSAPYPVFHQARSLADRLGAKPTTQVVKNLEVVVRDTLGEKAHQPEYQDIFSPEVEKTNELEVDDANAYSALRGSLFHGFLSAGVMSLADQFFNDQTVSVRVLKKVHQWYVPPLPRNRERY